MCVSITNLRISDPFAFNLEWPTPSKPASPLVTVPDELKGQGPPPMSIEFTSTESDAPRLSLQPTEVTDTPMRPRSMTIDDSPTYVRLILRTLNR